MVLGNYKPPVAPMILRLKQDAQRRGNRTKGYEPLREGPVAECKTSTAQQKGRDGLDKPHKPDAVWWPTATALDRQNIEVGVPFERKGERIMVSRTPSGVLTSRRVITETRY